jgi:hypothetical protein
MPAAEPVQNPDILLWALYDLGGADGFIDVEEAFYRAFQIAPDRLSWRTRTDIPDFKKCAEALNRAERRKPNLLVKNGADFRKLSVDGQRWVEQNFEWLADALTQSAIVKPPRQRRSSQIVSRALRSKIFEAWQERRHVPEEKWEMAELLNCSPDSGAPVWMRRLEELRSAAYASGESALLEFLDRILTDRAGWFNNG